MRVTMIGAGYVGLVSGACFADFGHHVTCVDKDAGRIAALRRGEIPIFEPGLADLVATNMAQERLSFSTKPDGIDEADAVFIAVGTPSRRGDGHADLSYIYSAVREIAPPLSPTAVVVTKSTVPVGTGDEIERSCATCGRKPTCTSSPTRNSCAKARQFTISSIRTASSSAATMKRRAP
jgi:UDPglucose 6-dehydrogenase